MDKNVSKGKVLVALSGGVDSSVATLLLKKQGFQVEAAFMRCYSSGAFCTSEKDETDAARVASFLDVPFRVFDFEKEYEKKVIENFFKEYQVGRTPNPDVLCNKEIKFGRFLDEAKKEGFDFIATGHYARVERIGGEREYKLLTGSDKSKDQSLEQYHLLAGSDPAKDQSYFLYRITQKALASILFPIGGLTKKEVRKIASKSGLPSSDRPESMGICFIGQVPVREFLRQKIKNRQGKVINQEGKVIGKHEGVHLYTIGQREGLGISLSIPYYVVGKDVAKNLLIVAPFGSEALFKKQFMVEDINWISSVKPVLPIEVDVKTRYRAKNIRGKIDKAGNKTLKATLEEPERALTPGQSAVFYNRKITSRDCFSKARYNRKITSRDCFSKARYKGEEVIGGGLIAKVID